MYDHQDNKNNQIRHRKRNMQQSALQSSISDISKQQIVYSGSSYLIEEARSNNF